MNKTTLTALIATALVLAPLVAGAQATPFKVVAVPGSKQAAVATTPATPAPAPAVAANPQLDEASKAALEESEKQRKETEAEAKKAAAAKRVLDIKRAREARIAKCVIRPVMTDDEIKYCREVSYL